MVRIGLGAARSRTAMLALLLALAGATPGGADTPKPESSVLTAGSWYLPGDRSLSSPPLVLVRGGRIAYTNLDRLDWHTVTSDEEIAWGVPIFESPTAAFRETVYVKGVEDLPPGTYGFHCSHHPAVMRGTLLVVDPAIS